MSVGVVTIAALAWLGALFLVAYAAERGRIPASVSRHPLVYALSLGVWASSWSYFGSVAYAASEGLRFLAIYLGATLSAVVAPVLWRPILRLTRELQLTSLADLFAYRYPGQLTGTVVALFLMAGSLPYLAMQIRAVSDSAAILGVGMPPWLVDLGYCGILVVFSILFGARHVTPRERHEGLVLAIAFESVLKVLALLAVGGFAVISVFGGPSGLGGWLAAHPDAVRAMTEGPREASWTPLLVLSFAAAFLLPRQFHVAFTESPERDALGTASWAFPLLLLLMNLAIPPILWAGMSLGLGGDPAFYVIAVPGSRGSAALAIAAFLGGVSASSAMVIVTALALAPMGLTYLVLPLGLARARKTDLYRTLLWARRALIAVMIGAGYAFFLALERRVGLVDLGLVAFVAVAQFLPGLAGLLLWPRATRRGFLAGLLAGAAVWSVALIWPLLSGSPAPFEAELRRLLGFAEAEPWGLVTFVSLAVNGLLFFGVSLATRQRPAEAEAAAVCAGRRPLGGEGKVAAASVGQFRELLSPLLGPEVAAAEVARAAGELGISEDETRAPELRRLRDGIERNLSGLLGPVLARMVVGEALQLDPSARTALADQIRFLEQRLSQVGASDATVRELEQVRRYLRRILEELPLGVCALGPDEDVVIWNDALEGISGIRADRAEGRRIRELPAPWGALLGELARSGEASSEAQVLLGGKERVLGLHRTALAEAQGSGAGAVLLVEDLTERKAIAARLSHQDRLASLGRVAAGVAHEIGNPLTGIASVAQNLKPDVEADAGERLDLILGQVRRIDAIVKALVSFGHAGAAVGGSPALAPVEVRALVDEAISLARLGRKRTAPACENGCPGGLFVQGDRQRLEQVLVNLLVNAFDASRADGRVWVESEEGQGAVRIRVRDEGAGIPEELRARIFEPFFTTKPLGQGTGLGLSVVAGIVQEHGGSVAVESRVGAGTTITVILPAPPKGEIAL